ncbi:orexin receptor type 2-like isoform X2 [Pomacea canaliculata]|uniref:orexin receptor type 2-like isoform X2 n=1 Tax=Pomacea canaliculata TaxID=400727 RepID=UPI000D72B86F|nr:orexin receptor type 2-like isoform X2 [Pomacea canaliculata]
MEEITFMSTEVFWNSTKLNALQELNWTQEKINEYLEKLNNETFIKLLPIFVFFITINLGGVFGNLLVFFVYLKQFKASATRVFVLAMAICDLLTNIFILPWLIQDIRYSYTSKTHFCKAKYAFGTFSVTMSYLILVCVAFDRRRRICHPLRRQLSSRQATYLLIASFMFASAIVFPFIPMYSVIPLDTDLNGITGTTCGIPTLTSSKMFVKQVLGTLLIITFATGLIVMTTCYTQISYRIYQQKKKLLLAVRINVTAVLETKTLPATDVEQKDGNMYKQSSVMLRNEITMLPTTENVNLSKTTSSDTKTFMSSTTSTDNNDQGDEGGQTRSHLSAKRPEHSHRKTTMLSKTTLMILANVQFVDVDLSSWKMNIYFLLRCFPTVNSVLNPFVYSFCNPKFRRESWCLLMNMCNTFSSRLCHPVQSFGVAGEEIGTAKPHDSSILFNLLIKCNQYSIITLYIYISGNIRLCYDSVCSRWCSNTSVN